MRKWPFESANGTRPSKGTRSSLPTAAPRALIAHLGLAPPQDATYYSVDQGVVYVFAGSRLTRYA
jgi:hypothetical protein